MRTQIPRFLLGSPQGWKTFDASSECVIWPGFSSYEAAADFCQADGTGIWELQRLGLRAGPRPVGSRLPSDAETGRRQSDPYLRVVAGGGYLGGGLPRLAEPQRHDRTGIQVDARPLGQPLEPRADRRSVAADLERGSVVRFLPAPPEHDICRRPALLVLARLVRRQAFPHRAANGGAAGARSGSSSSSIRGPRRRASTGPPWRGSWVASAIARSIPTWARSSRPPCGRETAMSATARRRPSASDCGETFLNAEKQKLKS